MQRTATWDGVQRVVEMRENTKQQVAIDVGQRRSDHAVALQIEKGGSVGACLDHDMIGFANQQERAMRLDRARQMDLLTFTIR